MLGLGSLKDKPWSEYTGVCFWTGAIARMTSFGLDPARRRHFLDQMIRKGATLPTLEAAMKETQSAWRPAAAQELIGLLDRAGYAIVPKGEK